MEIKNVNIVNVKFDTEKSEGHWVNFIMEVIINGEYKFTCKESRLFNEDYSVEVYGNINNYYQAAFEDWKKFINENLDLDYFKELIIDELLEDWEDINFEDYLIR